tara:strand:- start:10901 stop:11413 length:513 start_codon:yes stop_codon:yes gene_type:complete
MSKKNIIRVSSSGNLLWQGNSYRCALGKMGVSAHKREGDGATPVGIFPLREVFYRSDRLTPPPTKLLVSELRQEDGWCDDPDHPNYNKKVVLPHTGRCEELWRDEAIYDVIVVIGYNDDPPIPNKGSAIFLHIAREDYEPTEGCVALKRKGLLEIISELPPDSQIEISEH